MAGLVWAKGARNPRRFGFDRVSGDLYVGDVGDAQREEIDFLPPGSGGANLGWDVFEGSLCFEPAPLFPSCPAPTAGFTFPVREYDDSEGCSVTGGFVYRGCALPAVQGTYFYGDLCSAFVRSFAVSGGVAVGDADHTAELAPGGGLSIDSIISFGEDARGELYVVDQGGEVFQIVAGVEPPTATPTSTPTATDTPTIPPTATVHRTATDTATPSTPRPRRQWTPHADPGRHRHPDAGRHRDGDGDRHRGPADGDLYCGAADRYADPSDRYAGADGDGDLRRLDADRDRRATDQHPRRLADAHQSTDQDVDADLHPDADRPAPPNRALATSTATVTSLPTTSSSSPAPCSASPAAGDGSGRRPQPQRHGRPDRPAVRGALAAQPRLPLTAARRPSGAPAVRTRRPVGRLATPESRPRRRREAGGGGKPATRLIFTTEITEVCCRSPVAQHALPRLVDPGRCARITA